MPVRVRQKSKALPRSVKIKVDEGTYRMVKRITIGILNIIAIMGIFAITTFIAYHVYF